MQLSHTVARTRVAFDDPNLVSHGGLVPVMALAVLGTSADTCQFSLLLSVRGASDLQSDTWAA